MSLNSSCVEDEDVVSLKEAVEEEKSREEEAIAVLGAGDENNCTYPTGYMERQALFSCVTCDPLKESPAGVCYACAVHCHQGHDLVELYTKRNFRCDCGNSKFDAFTCSLFEEKEALNTNNLYNHNFIGKYCTCQRPYPDPDDEIEDEMIQCIVCEDWYHSRHLGCLAPADYTEMICDKCVNQHSFLQFYKEFTVPPVTVVSKGESSSDVDVETCVTNHPTTLQQGNSSSNEGTSGERSGEKNVSTGTCLLEKLKVKHSALPADELVVMFLEDSWRNKLCHCAKCLAMYQKEQISYIVNSEDTIQSYEQKGKDNVEKVWEEAASTISNMNKVQQVELLQGYHELKSGLQDFVSGFSDGQVIRKTDVENFFENLNKQKRRRMEGLPPQ